MCPCPHHRHSSRPLSVPALALTLTVALAPPPLFPPSLCVVAERAEFKRTHPTTTQWRGRGVADRADLNRLVQMAFILERDVDEYRCVRG
jgi:hypothetical protein